MLKNGLYNVAGSALRTGLTIVLVPLLIRLLGLDQYGLWSLVSAVVGIVALVEAGLSISTTVYVAQGLAHDDMAGIGHTLTVTAGAMLILATLAAAGLWSASGWLSGLFGNLSSSDQAAAAQAIQFGGIVIWARLLQQVFVGVEQAYQRYDILNILLTTQTVLTSVGLVLVAWLGGRAVALMQWQAVAGLAVLVLHAAVVMPWLRALNVRPGWNRSRSVAIGRYSLFTWLSSLGSGFFNQGDRLIVGGVLGTGVLGVYSAITSVVVQINVLSALPVQPILPALSSMFSKHELDRPTLSRHLKLAFGVNLAVALGLGALLLMFAPWVMTTLVSQSATAENITAFRVAVLIYAFYSLNAVGYYMLFAFDAVVINLLISLAGSIFALVLISILSTTLGLLGAVAGNAGFLVTLLFIPFALRKLRILLLQKEAVPHATAE